MGHTTQVHHNVNEFFSTFGWLFLAGLEGGRPSATFKLIIWDKFIRVNPLMKIKENSSDISFILFVKFFQVKDNN